jgi:hypothetical protein
MERAIQTSARYFPENPLKLQEARYLRAFGTVAFVCIDRNTTATTATFSIAGFASFYGDRANQLG